MKEGEGSQASTSSVESGRISLDLATVATIVILHPNIRSERFATPHDMLSSTWVQTFRDVKRVYGQSMICSSSSMPFNDKLATVQREGKQEANARSSAAPKS
jgi:hypothetical protein